MCVMAGIGLEDGKARQALASVRERLATPHGIVLQQPAYSRYYLHLGEISSYPPGYKENAGIFCHTNPWIMIAEATTGPRRPGARLLHAHQPLRPRGDQRGAPLRAVRLRADDRRARCPHARRGEELLADRHGRLELRRHHPVDSGHPPRARRPAHRARHPDSWNGFTATAPVPGYHVPHHRRKRTRSGQPASIASTVEDRSRGRSSRWPRTVAK